MANGTCVWIVAELLKKLNKQEMNINDFINSIDNKLYNRLRESKSDAECRRYLMEHAIKQLSIHGVSNSAYVKSSGDFRDDDNRESQAEYYGRK